MDMPNLSLAEIWSGGGNHIAVHPLRMEEAMGLGELAIEIGARGWCFFQASGSEGRPKWVGLEKEAFLISARAVNAHLRATAEDRWLCALPLNHVGGFSIHARCFASGAKVVTLPVPWDARAFAEACAAECITLTSLVPTQVHDLVTQNLRAPESMRAVLVGGGVLSPALRVRAEELGWPVQTTYGMTETASQIATEAGADRMEVLPHWQVSVDETQTLTVRGPALARGYATREKDGVWRWEPIDPALGLRTRDRVELTTEGERVWLRFLGRQSGLLKICGELVSLEALQNRLDQAALDLGLRGKALMVPLPDERRETRLVIVTEDDNEKMQARLLAAYNSDALPHESVLSLRHLPTLPQTPVGKPDLKAVIAILTAEDELR